MFLRTYRRSPQRRLLRALLFILGILLLLDLLTILKHYREFSRNLLTHTYTELSTLPSPLQNQKIFICAQFWTNAKVIHERWGQALLDLVEVLGKDNVHVSIYESGSLDNTKEILGYLDKALDDHKIPRTVVLDPTTHADVIAAGPLDEQGNPRPGWIQTPTAGAGKELRRIPYLARLRNKAMQPLIDLHSKGHNFDKILFLNDVVFRPSDVLSLLATNQGSFSAACALDFYSPPAYYDTFVLRDSEGDGTIMASFPYFRSLDSRQALLEGRAARVSSCWNGMITMDTTPFYEGLRFRALADSLASKHVEASECCLIHTDLASMSLASSGIYLNPAVRVGYTVEAYNLTHLQPGNTFVSSTQYVMGMWLNRIKRNITPRLSPQVKEVARKLEQWKAEGANSLEKREETGQMCIIPEQHILTWNGWKHT
ncbi:hypothetical protein ABEF95_002072 [Exophiala dermatitidis]